MDHKHQNHHAHMVADFKKRFFVSVVLTLPILILSPMIKNFLGWGVGFTGDLYILLALSSIIYFYGGWPFLKGFFDEIKNKTPGMMTLIAVAITTAYVYSSAVVFGLAGKLFFWELATLIDVMLVGHWIEMRSIMGASRALEELAKLMPSIAHKMKEDGNFIDVLIEELKAGNKVLVKPGEKIPVDGKVIKGETSVNESMLTGESKPVFKKIDEKVIGASINGDGSIIVLVEKIGKDSYLSQVIDLVRQAQESKSKTQDLANKAALWLTISALSVGVLTLFLWIFFSEKDLFFAIERTVTVMVIACPHALGLAVPLVVAVSTSLAASNGFLIRNRTAFESMRKVNAVIFDKTGTLTKGEFGITDVISFSENITKDEILNLAASVDSHSSHPIAKSIASSAKEIYDVSNFKSIPGKGSTGVVKDKNITVASPRYLREQNVTAEIKEIEEIKNQGKTISYILEENRLIGVIALADIVRPESKKAISILRDMGIKSIMLTGDNKQVAEQVAKEIGIDEFVAEVLPQNKLAKIKEIQSRNLIIAMIGDGVNDAPALAQANVGIAIGAGTDVAIETADVILVKSNPLDIVGVISLSRSTYGKMIQNLIWATGYNVIAIPIAAGVLYSWNILLSPALGALFMSLSTVIVAINARLLKITKNK
ncbi:copper-translocating P-type ATPase [Candidatus Parcubacteria bacterium]|nr:copper-translocating P-type ATPase [Candidatus Parcubacteria bacterium]